MIFPLLYKLMLQVVISGIYLFDLCLILNIVNVISSDIISAVIKYTRLIHIMYTDKIKSRMDTENNK